jgi:hypothetical protein
MKSPMSVLQILDLELDVGIQARLVPVTQELIHMGGIGPDPDHPCRTAPAEGVRRGGLSHPSRPRPAKDDLADWMALYLRS